MMRHWLICFVGLFCNSAFGQTYVVTVDSAPFMDGDKPVGSAARGVEVFVTEKRDGWVKAVAPDSLISAWIAGDHVTAKQIIPQQIQRLKELEKRSRAVVELVNSGRADADDFAATKQWMEDTVAIRGDIHPESVRAVQHTGLVAQNARQLSDARRLLTTALTNVQRIFGKQSEQTAEIHLDLSYVLADMSLLADAARQAKAAALIYSELFGANHPRTAEAFVPLAIAMESIGENADALKFYRQVYSSYEAGYGAGDERTLKIASRAADVAARMNDKAFASSVYQNVLDVLEGMPQADSRWIARIRLKLDLLEVDTGNAAQLMSFLERTEQFKADQVRDVAFAEEVERKLVSSLLQQGRSEEALKIMDTVLRRLRKQLRVDLWGLDENLQVDYLQFADGGRFFEAVASAVPFHHSEAVLKLSSEWLLNGKGLIREVNAVRQGFHNQLDRRNTWAAQPYVEVSQLRDALPAGAVLVDILRFTERKKSSSGESELKPQYAAWVTPKEGRQQLVRLGDAQHLDKQIREFRSILLKSAFRIQKDGEGAALAMVMPSLRALSQTLWLPVAEAVGDATTVIVCPDGDTWLAPWSALLNSDGSYAVETHLIQLQVSGRQLVEATELSAASTSVIFAAPDYGATTQKNQNNTSRSTESTTQVPAVGPLDSTASEAAAAHAALTKLSSAEPEVLLGVLAAEARFKSLKSPAVVSVSTHGFYLAEDPLGPDTEPLLRCGLLLKNANLHRDHRLLEDDGVLTGLEVVATDLSNTRLAVLSACETGVGQTVAVEGVAGLTSAFHLAGARCVVSTLWPIHDKETAYLMAGFFEGLATTPNAAEALRQAQIERIDRHRNEYGAAHPFFWAAFTASGNVSTDMLTP